MGAPLPLPPLLPLLLAVPVVVLGCRKALSERVAVVAEGGAGFAKNVAVAFRTCLPQGIRRELALVFVSARKREFL